MKTRKNIEKFIKNAAVNSNPQMNRAVLNDLLKQLDKKENDSRKEHRSIIMKNPFIKLAAAAVLLLGLFMLGRYLIGNEIPQNPNQTREATTTQDEDQNDANNLQMLLNSELETAKQLFEKKDLPGLTQLLQNCQDPTKLQVAEYLGQIGDKSVLPTLQIFAEKWSGPELENPFREAIEAIEARQAESEPIPQVTNLNEEPNQTQILKPSVQTGVKGIVIDKNTAEPIPAAQVGFRTSEMVAVDTDGRFQLIYTNDYEETYVCAAAPGYATKRIMVRIKRGSINEVTFELSPGSKLAGTVTDPNGQPVEGAKVSVFGLTLPGGKVTTDEKGQFEIDGLNPAGQYYQIQANHPEYPAVSVSIDSAPEGQTLYQDIVLKPGVTIFGQVTNPEGLPVAEVMVGNTRSRSMWNNITTETDEEGMYQLDNIDIGELILWTVHDRYAPFVKYTTLEMGPAEQRIDIRLKASRVLRGCVVDADGNPVTKATITISEYDGVSNLDRNHYLCDSDGRFTIANAPPDGSLILWVFGDGITGKDYTVDFGQDECLITVERTGKIYGKVVDNATGEPITKFLVKMSATRTGPPTYGYSSAWSEEGYTFNSVQGIFDTGRQNLPVNSQFQMTVSAEGYDPVTLDPVIVQPISEDPNRTEFRLQTGKVFAGRVITSDVKPIKGAVVVFFSDINAEHRDSWPRAATDKTGIFTISGLGDEPQCVFVSASGFTPRAYLMSNLLEAPNHFSDIVLDHAAALFGCVLDENGNGIAGASVGAFVDTSQIRDVLTFHPRLGPRVHTDKDGNYHLPDVPIGRVQISVMSPSNYNLFHKTVDIKPGDLMELNFGDEGGYTITGTIKAGNDVLERADISLSTWQMGPSSSYFNNQTTNAEGRFKFIHVPEGQYSMYVFWTPHDTRLATMHPEDTKFDWLHRIEVRKNMELDIDMVEGTINGVIPSPLPPLPPPSPPPPPDISTK